MALFLYLLACDSITFEEEKIDSEVLVDADGDGYYTGDDCDDQDSSRYPGAHENTSDGVDSNCDGEDDS